jgi:peptide/nickel transport system permease protein
MRHWLMQNRPAAITSAVRTPVTVASVALVLLALLTAVTIRHLGLPDPEAMDATPFLPPGAGHWLGADNYGRDLLARIAWGTRVAIIVAVGSSAVSTLIGIVIGSISGFYGGWIDAVLSRTFDVFLLIPAFFLVLLMVSLFGASLGFTMMAIAITTWPRSGRIMRSQVLTLKSRSFVQAAFASGAACGQALRRHVIPNGLAPLITDGTLLMGLAILTEAGLSFLGLGDQNTVSWGRMIYEGQPYLRLAPWLSIFPGLSMLLLVSALNLLGDSFNIALNPQLRRRGGQPLALRRIEAAQVPAAASPQGILLDVQDLRLAYRVGEREIRAVDGVSFTLAAGESLGVVGESGCGKSSLGAALLQLLPQNAELRGGTVRFRDRTVLHDGMTVTANGRPVFDQLRWTRISVVFQSAMNALNPVIPVRRQLIEALRLHRPDIGITAARQRVAELFDTVGIPRARLGAYPFELSGGMRQRVMIALAMLLEPGLVIADEPTTALDVLIQDQILREIDALRRRMNLSLILISHDMGAVATTCDRVAVMYAGEIVEIAATATIFERPCHPYTRALIGAAPKLHGPRRMLTTLLGEPLVPTDLPPGCRFAPRCPNAAALCRDVAPPALALGADHVAACHFAQDFALAAKPEPVT